MTYYRWHDFNDVWSQIENILWQYMIELYTSWSLIAGSIFVPRLLVLGRLVIPMMIKWWWLKWAKIVYIWDLKCEHERVILLWTATWQSTGFSFEIYFWSWSLLILCLHKPISSRKGAGRFKGTLSNTALL